MYFGSVKFFRHLILTVVFGWIGVATVLAVFFGVKCHMLEKGERESLTIEEHISQMNADGYSAEEIEAVLRRTDGLGGASGGIVLRPEDDGEAVPAAVSAADPSGEDKAPSAESAVESEQPDNTENTAPSGDYTSLYPQMYAEKPGVTAQGESGKTVYLTFEGAPSGNMSDILIILGRQSSGAAFFTESCGSDEDEEDILRRASNMGNTVGVLAGEGKEYSSAADYLADFAAVFDDITRVCGEAPYLYRIPESAVMSEQTRQEVCGELERRGFISCTETGAADDTSAGKGWQELYDEIYGEIDRLAGNETCIIKLHGGRDNYLTVCTVEDVISDMRQEGYVFKAFDGSK